MIKCLAPTAVPVVPKAGDELVSHWDASVFLDVPFTETAARMAIRNGSNPDPEHPTMRRYVGGQRLYFEAARPWERATFVVDNFDFASPRLIHPGVVSVVRLRVTQTGWRDSLSENLNLPWPRCLAGS